MRFVMGLVVWVTITGLTCRFCYVGCLRVVRVATCGWCLVGFGYGLFCELVCLCDVACGLGHIKLFAFDWLRVGCLWC